MERKHHLRLSALLLAASLCITPALAVERTPAEAEPASAEETQLSGAETAGDSASAAESNAAAEEAAETGDGADSAGTEGALPEEMEIPEDAPGTLSFENLERRLRENNLNVLTIQESVSALEELDYEDLADNFRKSMAAIAKMQWSYVKGVLPDIDEETGSVSFIQLSGDHSYAEDQLQAGYDALREQFDAIQDGEMQKDNAGIIRQLKNLQDQIVMGGETLYLTLAELEVQEDALERQLEALDRTAEEMQLRYQMGQISALQLQQVLSGRSSLESGLCTLQMNIRTLKDQLELMVGEPMTGEVVLTGVPSVAAELLDTMDLEKDLAAAKAVSYEVYAAEKALEDAEEDYLDIWKNTRSDDVSYKNAVHDRAAAKYTYEAAVRDYELRFRKLYYQVGDHAQILKSAQTALDYERGVYTASELKYQQGSISRNALLSAADTLKSAEETAASAANDLFASYHTYCWAVEHGILN